MSKTRNERKRRRTVLGAFLLLLLTLLAFLAALLVFGTASAQETAGEAPVPSEDRIEGEIMANAAVVSACASEAKVVVGYDWDYVCRVVMQEAGSNSEELQLAVCQAIQNRCRTTLLNP